MEKGKIFDRCGAPIRKLSRLETRTVSGGFGPVGIVLGTIAGAANGYRQSGWSGAASGALFGAAVGATGGLAAATTGFARLAWSVRSIGLTVAGGAISDVKSASS